MHWLISQMWIALAAAGVLGLLLGMALRGLFVGNRIRKAMVERDIALTELEQTRSEVDALYAAQRKRQDEAAQTAQAVSGDDSLQVELEQRENKILELGSELMSARAELESLRGRDAKGDLAGKAGAALAAAAASSAMSQEEADALNERNRWLEERIASLEAEVSAAPGEPEAAEPVAALGDVSLEKLNWQNAYLRQRVEALEGVVAEAPESVASAVPVAAPVEDTPVAEPTPDAGDEELARLRWRNRYLEGRLAYYEDGNDEEASETGSSPEQAPNETGSETEVEPVVADSEIPSESVEDAPEPEAEPHPADALLKELDAANIMPVQPTQIDNPGDDADDLTQITGIGPKIAEVLNGLGIWTFAQISEWTPENTAWIDQHLSFQGRIEREGWIVQAAELGA